MSYSSRETGSGPIRHLPEIAFVCGITLLSFVWGVAAIEYRVFPYKQLVWIKAGFDAMGKLEDQELPYTVIRLGTEASDVDTAVTLGPAPDDQLILMTGGFHHRRDLCPTFGCLAYVMDRAGKVFHTWEVDPEALFPPERLADFSGKAQAENVYVQGLDMTDQGDLIVTFQARNMYPYHVGIARVSWSGAVDWVRPDHSHHWPTVTGDGTILTPAATVERAAKFVAATRVRTDCKLGSVFQEGVSIISPDGTQATTHFLDASVRASDMQGLAYAVRNDCDPYHVNAVVEVTPVLADTLEGVTAGDLLVSLRSSSSLVILDRDSGVIKYHYFGPMVAQHSPRILPDGTVLVFDNQGGQTTGSGTRILRVDLAERSARTVFPTAPDQAGGDLDAEVSGAVRESPDGRFMLISETINGRVIEVDMDTGEAVWIFKAISDLAPYLKEQGEDPDGPVYARLQTHGADYLSKADFARLSRH
ncbi:arylsulfotransferase family protein [Fluviibacterium sp. DFM31]|uniref:Arylsulfotransferase family protein n=1 Tax=Meridianimarinicoccus marinus TaxID=3231483 RepID=A0ABV3L5E1_9RHOB